MKEDTKCDIHDEEIYKLRSDFDGFRTNINSKIDGVIDDSDVFRHGINSKIDNIMEQLKKPILTPYQTMGLFLAFVGYMAAVMTYGGNIKSDVRKNSIDNEYTKGDIKEIKSDVKEILKIIK